MSYPPNNQQPENQAEWQQPAEQSTAPYQPEAPTQVFEQQQFSYEAPAQHQQAAPEYQQAPLATTVPTTLAHTNTFALVSILTVFLTPIAGIVFGHLALSQIKRNGDSGRGLALTGVILGYAYFAFLLLFIIFYISIIGIIFASFGVAMSELGTPGAFDGGSSW